MFKYFFESKGRPDRIRDNGKINHIEISLDKLEVMQIIVKSNQIYQIQGLG
jgi:hypothetical protein